MRKNIIIVSMRKKIIIMSISAIAAILFWTATIMYDAHFGVNTKLYGTQLLISVLLTLASYAATITAGASLNLIIREIIMENR